MKNIDEIIEIILQKLKEDKEVKNVDIARDLYYNNKEVRKEFDGRLETLKRRVSDVRMNNNLKRIKKDKTKKELEKEKIKYKENKYGAEVSGQAYSLPDLLKNANVDLEVWEVDTWEIKDEFWDVTMKLNKPSGNDKAYALHEVETHQNKLFYIKAKLKPRKDFTSTKKFRDELLKEIKLHSPVVKLKKYKSGSGNMFELPITDIHLGKMAWDVETGTDNYDTKIAFKRVIKATEDLLSRALQISKFEKILIPINGDLFNSDNNYPYPATTKGTPQQDDLRWQKVFRIGRKLVMQIIETAAEIAPVEVIVIQGNHDFQKLFYLGEVLEAKYDNNENITIDNRPRHRKYTQWGDCMIGFVHGSRNQAGEKRLMALMPQEEPKMWADTKYREWHLGDIHHEKLVQFMSTEDFQGLTMRYLKTIMNNDSWEAGEGYVSMKGMISFIWNKEHGLTYSINFNL